MIKLLAAFPTQPSVLLIIVLCMVPVVLLGVCATLIFLAVAEKKRVKNKTNSTVVVKHDANESTHSESATEQSVTKKDVPPSPTEEIFLRHKIKYSIGAIIKSAICGISLGLLIVGIVLLSLKLNAVTISAGYYVLMGVCVALICGAIVFLILRPTDKRVARKLDEEYRLNERVQTSLAFKEQEGLIVELQREDAGEVMKNLPRRRPSFAKVWQYCVIAVLALSLSFTAFFIPAKQLASGEPNGPWFELDPDTAPWTFDAIMEQKVRDLIEDVKSSHLDDFLKEATIVELEQLIVSLRTTETVGGMHNNVNYTIYKVDNIIAEANNYTRITESSKLTLPELAMSIDAGISTYDTYLLTDYNNVKFYYTNKFELITRVISPYITELQQKTLVDKDAGLEEKLTEASTAVLSVISDLDIDKNDLFNVALTTYLAELENVRSRIASSTGSALQALLDSVYINLSSNLADAIAVQAYNLAIGTHVGYRLKIIFGMELILPGNGPSQGDGPDSGEPPIVDVPPGGWDIDSTPKYGSDEEIFDPIIGDYVKYGDVIARYYAIFNEYLAKGQLTPEQEHAARVYFELLFTGFED